MTEIMTENIFECMNGVCQHPEHKINAIWWLAAGIVLLVVAMKSRVYK